MANKKLRVGIIGTGGISGAHTEKYLKMPDDVEIVAGADIVPGKAEDYFKRWDIPAKAYTDHREMLEKENLDAVSVCTYNRTHAECTINALNAGVN
ncbi:MAG: Gfo/Idh/MocA family oxidoreductase, partial [Clostridia bacterium]|nr:Gfo/Idh/MocA family oxidoreductase [Clostridia bacterium]